MSELPATGPKPPYPPMGDPQPANYPAARTVIEEQGDKVIYCLSRETALGMACVKVTFNKQELVDDRPGVARRVREARNRLRGLVERSFRPIPAPKEPA